MKKIGIIGPNREMCSKELYAFGVEMGMAIANKEHVIMCGGLGGFMEAVCKGAKQSGETFDGQTIGILPDDNSNSANPYVDIAIPTGMGLARNIIIVNSADILIAAGGGAGTLSELAFAWQKGKTVLCVNQFGGWAEVLADEEMDVKGDGRLVGVESIDSIMSRL